jgi:D-serine deaminase-like pyridoxal phosphate-dependent protein
MVSRVQNLRVEVRRKILNIEPGMKLEDLDTPAMLVDLDKMERNIASWQAEIGSHNLKLRPHVKTHKVPDIAKLQLEAGASGITVAKVAEAEVFAAQGIKDIFIAYPIVGAAKWKRVADLAKDCQIMVGVDSEIGTRGLNDAARDAGLILKIRLEIDGGLNRSGVVPSDALKLCQIIQTLPNLELDGIFGFRSIFFAAAAGRTPEEIGLEEGEFFVNIANQLRSSGVPIRHVSIGSTPTAKFAARVPGVTEVRPGTYIFGDYMMAEFGAVDYENVALSILCTVISLSRSGQVTIDGGSKTFCGDVVPSKLNLKGYAKAVHHDAYLESMSEEHGVVKLGEGVKLEVGDRLAFYPIHVCTTVNLSNELVGIRNGQVEKVWQVLARGKRT